MKNFAFYQNLKNWKMQAAIFITDPREKNLPKKIDLINSDTCWLSNAIEITFKF